MKRIIDFFKSISNKFIIPVLRGSAEFFMKLWRHKKGRVGLIMVAVLILIAVLAPVLTGYDPYGYDVPNQLLKPSSLHWLGTDKNGADILTQLVYGTRISLIIGLVTGVSVTLLGAVLGIIAGYFGKVASGIILNVINVLMVIPTLPLMLVLNKVSSSYVMMIFIFVAFGWTGSARVVRAQTLSVIGRNYVKQAELSGAGKFYIMRKHILPAVSHLLIMNCALSCAGFMIAEAGLSFIGIGDPNTVSWGKILVAAEGSAFTSGLWAWILAPGAAIFFAVTGFMQIGYAVEDIFNPKMSRINRADKFFKKTDGADALKAFAEMRDMTAEEAEEIRKREGIKETDEAEEIRKREGIKETDEAKETRETPNEINKTKETAKKEEDGVCKI